jgi:hypothetical protein
MIRWMDSVMFSQDPLSGVYIGITPCSNNHTTKLAVRCPLRLSMTNSRRSGGGLSHNVGNVGTRSGGCSVCWTSIQGKPGVSRGGKGLVLIYPPRTLSTSLTCCTSSIATLTVSVRTRLVNVLSSAELT